MVSVSKLAVQLRTNIYIYCWLSIGKICRKIVDAARNGTHFVRKPTKLQQRKKRGKHPKLHTYTGKI